MRGFHPFTGQKTVNFERSAAGDSASKKTTRVHQLSPTSLQQAFVMVHYHCPYCGILIQHRPRLAGDRVTCSKCNGAYYEPTDPLPGVKPEKAPADVDTPIPDSPATTVQAAGRSTAAPSHLRDLAKCEPGDMVAELASRGQNAILLFWNPANPSDAGLAYSKKLSRQQADDQLIQVAAHVMQQKWPDLHQLILNRLAKS